MMSDDFTDDVVLAQYYGTLNDDIVEEVDNDNPMMTGLTPAGMAMKLSLPRAFCWVL